MKLKLILAFQLFFLAQLSATVQPSLAQVKNYAKKTSWAFEENKGQVTGKDRKKVKYFFKQGRTSVFLMKNRIAYQFEDISYPSGYKELLNSKDQLNHDSIEILAKQIRSETYRMDLELIDANKNCEIIAEGKSIDYLNYYTHNTFNIHSYQKITYKNIYPNIDWVIYTQSKDKNEKLKTENSPMPTEDCSLIKYDFVIHPGGHPSDIKIKSHWVENLNIKADGSITLANRMGSITEKMPISFQSKKEITTNFRLDDNTISFQVADYDRSQTLVIDPEVAWSTYYGGSLGDRLNDCKTDNQGNVYITGSTSSTNNIAAGGHQIIYGGHPTGSVQIGMGDAFLVKFNSNGTRLWATYFGGSYGDQAFSCAIDSKDNVYICGRLGSSELFYNGYQNSTTASGFFAKFNPYGIRIWCSSYFSSQPVVITIDNNDNIIIVGGASNQTGLTQNAHQTNPGGSADLFLAKFDSSLNRIFCTYYGGSGWEEPFYSICAVDNDRNIYIGGITKSSNNIAFNGIYNVRSSNTTHDAFVAKFSPTGVRQWGTYIGNNKPLSSSDYLYSMKIDNQNNIILGGQFADKNLATINYSGNDTVPYLLKFDPLGQLVWGRGFYSSYCPWGPQIYRLYLCTDNQQNIYMFANDYCDHSTALDSIFYQARNTEYSLKSGVIKFNKNGQRLWGYNYGGQGYDRPTTIAMSNQGELYIGGITDTIGNATANPQISSNLGKKGHQMNYGGNIDGFLAKICLQIDTPKIEITSNRGNSICGGQIKYTATDTFEGDKPIYTWYKNGTPIGSDTNVILMASIQNKDSFKCRLISTATCIFKDTVWSNLIVMNIKAADSLHIYDTICSDQSYFFDGKNRTQVGIYIDSLTSMEGCDSFIFLHLYVKNTTNYNFSHTTPCNNPSYTFNGLARTQSGTYTAKYLNTIGCDSTVTLTLIVRQPNVFSLPNVVLCSGSSYTFAGIPRTASGVYTEVLTNAQGCDSTVSVTIQVLNNPAIVQNPISACSPYTFKGKTYTNSTIIIDTIQNHQGCDSLYVRNVLALKPLATQIPEIEYQICDSIRKNGKLYKTSFIHIDTIRTKGTLQCDSIYQPIKYTIHSTPSIGLEAKDSFIRGSNVELKPNAATHYLWSTGQTTQNISFKLMEEIKLYLIAWNHELCRDTQYITLLPLDLAEINFPTGFAPNGEYPENRRFRPNVKGRLESMEFTIFNRIGEKVYHSKDIHSGGWDGVYKNQLAPHGVYTYIFEYTTLGNHFIRTGEVFLVR